MQKHSMTALEQEAPFRRWLAAHLGLMLKIVRGCVQPQDQDDLFQDVLPQLGSSIPACRGDAKEPPWIWIVPTLYSSFAHRLMRTGRSG